MSLKRFWDRLRMDLGVRREDIWLLCFVVLVSLVLRLYRLYFPTDYNLDEVYYVPAARSYYVPYMLDPNPAHPPLAKILMGFFIRIFGDTPSGWRSGSVFFGVLGIILVYIFGKVLFRNKYGAFFSSLLVSLDFLHIVQSRIATLDIYSSFFILGAIFFAYLYARDNFNIFHPYLILSAIFVGLATSCKLSGLSSLLTISMFLVALNLAGYRDRFPCRKIISLLGVYLGITVLVFILSHIPLFIKGIGPSYLLYRGVLTLHYKMEFHHPQLAHMTQWLLLQKPFWYYYVNDTHKRTLTCIFAWGNFVFWWGFLILYVRMVYMVFRYRDINRILILTGFAGLYLFWLSSFQIREGHFMFKGGFFYYMLPSIPFMAFTVADALKDAWESKVGRISVGIYFLALIYFFWRWHVVLYGIEKPYSYFDSLFGENYYFIVSFVLIVTLQIFAYRFWEKRDRV